MKELQQHRESFLGRTLRCESRAKACPSLRSAGRVVKTFAMKGARGFELHPRE
jgi:hypothetical protein